MEYYRSCANCNYKKLDIIDYPCNECDIIKLNKWETYDPDFWLNCIDELRKDKEEKSIIIDELYYTVYKLKKLKISKEEIIELINNAFKKKEN